jgi:hypothetical protein
MKRIASFLALVAIFLFPVVLALTVPAIAAGDAPGQGIFIAQKCNMCHSIDALGIEATTKSEKMKASDLSKIGAAHDAAFLAKYLQKEEQVGGEAHKASWKGSDAELAQLTDWLASLK